MLWMTSLMALARSAPCCTSHEAAYPSLVTLHSISSLDACLWVLRDAARRRMTKGLAEAQSHMIYQGRLILMPVLQLLKDITHWG